MEHYSDCTCVSALRFGNTLLFHINTTNSPKEQLPDFDKDANMPGLRIGYHKELADFYGNVIPK